MTDTDDWGLVDYEFLETPLRKYFSPPPPKWITRRCVGGKVTYEDGPHNDGVVYLRKDVVRDLEAENAELRKRLGLMKTYGWSDRLPED